MKQSHCAIGVVVDNEFSAAEVPYPYRTTEDVGQLITVAGDAAYVLYDYYLNLSNGMWKHIFDKDVAKYLDWSPSKVKEYRLRLTRAGYFRWEWDITKKGVPVVKLWTGLRAVAEYEADHVS